MAIDFPSSPTNGQIHTDAEGREYVWINALSRWQGNGGHAQAALTKPLAAVNGEIYFNPTTKELEVWNDSTSNWMLLNSPSIYTEAAFALTSSPQTFLFTGIPATATEIKIQAQPITASNGITTIRVGTSGGLISSNYWFSRTDVSGGGVGSFGTRTNAGWDNYPIPAGQPSILTMTLKKGGSTNEWSMSGTCGSVGSNNFVTMLGSINVGGSLERIQFFDSGGTGLTYGPTPGGNPEIRIYYR